MRKHLKLHSKLKRYSNIAHITLYRPKYELRKILWEINPYDLDENPNLSKPHGDDYSPSYHTLKLNVYTGEIYTSRHRKFYGKLTKKELKRLHEDPKFIDVCNSVLNSDNKIKRESISQSYLIELECIKIKNR